MTGCLVGDCPHQLIQRTAAKFAPTGGQLQAAVMLCRNPNATFSTQFGSNKSSWKSPRSLSWGMKKTGHYLSKRARTVAEVWCFERVSILVFYSGSKECF